MQYQILKTHVMNSVEQTVRKITNKIVGVNGLIYMYL